MSLIELCVIGCTYSSNMATLCSHSLAFLVRYSVNMIVARSGCVSSILTIASCMA